MSRKYFDRLLTGTGETSKEVKSKFGMKIMQGMGWEQGKGLGKSEDGMRDCVQIKRREEGAALGAENMTPGATFKWADAFWDDAYNAAAKNFNDNAIKPGKLVKSDSESDSSDMSDFIIVKSKKRVFVQPEKKEKKSKKIKKDKKEKKSKKQRDDSDWNFN